MAGLILLLTATLLYAGYNLLIKVSGGHVPKTATTTVLGAICLQLAALATSLTFASWLYLFKGAQSFQLTTSAYLWAVAAGICIGGAEIVYFYLFGGIGTSKPMAASASACASARSASASETATGTGTSNRCWATPCSRASRFIRS